MAMNVKKGDTVVVLSGKDKGKQGKVLGTVPSEAKVVVEGINMVTCHVKPRKQGETGGIVSGGCHVRLQGACSCAPSAEGHPRRAQELKMARRPACASTAARASKKGE